MFGSSTPDGLAPIGSLALLIFISCISGLSMLWGLANLFSLLRFVPDGESSEKLDRVFQLYRKLLRGAINITKLNIIVGLAATVLFLLLIMGTIEHFDSFYFSMAFLVGSLNSILIAIVSTITNCIVKAKIITSARFSIFQSYDAARKAANFQTYFFIGETILIIGMFLVNYQMQNQQKIKNAQQIIKIAKCLVYYSFGASTIAIGARIINSIYAKGAQFAMETLDVYQDRLRRDYKHPALIAKALGQIVNKQVSSVLDSVTYLSAGISVAVYAASYNIVGTDQQGQIIFEYALGNCYLPILSFLFSLFYNLFFTGVFHFAVKNQTGEGIRTVININRYLTIILLAGFQSLASYLCLPAQFYINELGPQYIKYPWQAYLCILFGLLTCTIVTLVSQIYTTHPFFINSLSTSSKTGSATNIIYGLSFGYFFNIIPVGLISVTLFFSQYFLGAYGVGLVVIGFLALLPHYLSGTLIYSSLQNSSYISYIAQFEQTLVQSLVQASKTRKDFEPHIAVFLNCLTCYFGFQMVLTFTNDSQYIGSTSLRSPLIFLGLLIGAMFPYFFASNLLRSIQKTSPAIHYDLKMQTQQIPGMANGNMDPDFVRTSSLFSFQCMLSLKRFIFVLIGPIVLLGIAGGPGLVIGFLCGTTISGIQLGLSSGLSGCGWITIKKQIGFNNIRDQQGNPIKSGSQWERAVSIGNSIGQPLRDCINVSIPLIIVYWGLQNFSFGLLYNSIH